MPISCSCISSTRVPPSGHTTRRSLQVATQLTVTRITTVPGGATRFRAALCTPRYWAWKGELWLTPTVPNGIPGQAKIDSGTGGVELEPIDSATTGADSTELTGHQSDGAA